MSGSLRDLGYSLETAVADLVDNSVTAGATKVDIVCVQSGSTPVLSITDNGCGMSGDELLEAMRHGSRGTASQAGPDLGRFGLGLKTASFSQCRQLTVVSTRKGDVSAVEWDIDLVVQRNDWLVSVLEPEEVSALPHISSLGESGTIVLWRKMDRLTEEEMGEPRDVIVNEKLDLVRSHLSLVFHRFLSGDVCKPRLQITVNGLALDPFDPFCRSNRATQVLPKESVLVGGERVTIQAYVLPHHSRLSQREYDFYRTRSDFISNQGAYIYRSGRLIAWGDWFRLVQKGEATKLGRVQIDYPSTMDDAWTIDIKKSRATPPREVREHVRQVLPRITGAAVRVHRGRGQRLYEDTEFPVWERYADQDRIRYTINLQHPVVSKLEHMLDADARGALRLLLDSVASSLPVEMLYSDYSTNPREMRTSQLDQGQVSQRLRELKLLLYPDGNFDEEAFKKVVLATRLTEGFERELESFLEEE